MLMNHYRLIEIGLNQSVLILVMYVKHTGVYILLGFLIVFHTTISICNILPHIE